MTARINPASSFGPLDASENPEDHAGASRLYTKQPLLVPAGSSFDLIVPPGERNRLAIGWGNAPTTPSGQVHVSCKHQQEAWSDDGQWMNFAGGYYASEPVCATLIVRVGGQDHRIRIGVGADCPEP